MRPDHAPTPFSAAEIRAGCPAGRTSVYLIHVPLSQPVYQTLRFLGGDAGHAELELVTEGEKPSRTRAPWTELQSHASFPAAATGITRETVRTPAGRFDCWLYTVRTSQNGKIRVTRLYFARDLPGPPVRRTVEIDGQSVHTMTLVEHGPGGP
jgi:hypothetical protein